MIPLRDEHTSSYRGVPWVMLTILVVNILVFGLELLLGDRFVNGYAMIPAEILGGRDLISPTGPIDHGPGPTPIYLTLLTSMFLHADLLHIGSNMLFLFIFGDNVEMAMGHLKFLIFYLLTGLLAGAAHIIFNMDPPNALIPTVGASGAIAGVLGAYIILFPSAQVRTLLILGIFITIARIPALIMIGFWFVTQIIQGVVSIGSTGEASGVAVWAHVGGFIAGAALVFVFRNRQAAYV